jgi:hypothetical protein
MESGDSNAATPSRAVTGWTVGLTCVAIVATGVIVGGLLHEPQLELTTEPLTPTASVPPEPVEYSYVTAPVTFPARIPGCDVVEPPGKGRSFMSAFSDEFGYDNPSYPWFSGPKAVAMTQALHDALPEDVVVAFASVDQSLLFRPILGNSTESQGFGGWTNAHATLLRGARAGALSVTVRQSTAPIPPCVAGDLDERRHLIDGTIVDTHDTWSETDGVRTLTRTASAYLPDGSVAHANADDVAAGGTGHTGAVPLSVDDLVTLVTAPGLAVTASVAPGTPNPPESCDAGSESSAAVDQADADRLDAVLARIPLDGLTLDQPLGALRPTDTGGVCQAVRVTTPGQQSRLSIAITTGQVLPPESDPSSDNGAEHATSRRLADGSVVENREWRTTMADPKAQPSSQSTRIVIVTRRSGARVQLASAADVPAEPLSFALLEAIALTPGLEVP